MKDIIMIVLLNLGELFSKPFVLQDLKNSNRRGRFPLVKICMNPT